MTLQPSLMCCVRAATTESVVCVSYSVEPIVGTVAQRNDDVVGHPHRVEARADPRARPSRRCSPLTPCRDSWAASSRRRSLRRINPPERIAARWARQASLVGRRCCIACSATPDAWPPRSPECPPCVPATCTRDLNRQPFGRLGVHVLVPACPVDLVRRPVDHQQVGDAFGAVVGGHDDLADVHVDLVLRAALVDLAVAAVGWRPAADGQRLAPGRTGAERAVLGVQVGIAVAVVVVLAASRMNM